MEEEIIIDDIAHLALQYINYTSRHIFLTGKAGTGKTTLLRYFLNQTHKNTVVAAPTGIAAINAGGVTLHSLFQLPFGTFVPSNFALPFDETNRQFHTPATLMKEQRLNTKKRQLIREIELLIIDEVSMLRADLLDAIDMILRKVRRHDSPFGGVQILFIGDLYQLPPVVQRDEMSILQDHYNSLYFYEAHALKKDQPIYIELQKVHRQSDSKFISLLNRIRNQELIDEDQYLLQDHYASDGYIPEDEGHIFLTTHNQKAAEINQQKLDQLNTTEKRYQARISGKFDQHLFPNEAELILKEGAQVMFIKNDPTGSQRFFNGKIGVVTGLYDQKVLIECDGTDIEVERYTWENKRFKVDPGTREIEEDTVGEFAQFPIRLAWAVTVHKSQGLTFEKAILDLENAFAPGQFYVAMSRLTSLNGLIFASPIPHKSFEMDASLIEFTDRSISISNLEADLLRDRRGYIIDFIHRAFDFRELSQIIQNVILEFRRLQVLDPGDELWSEIMQWRDKVNNWISIGRKFGQEVFTIGTSQDEYYINHLGERIEKAEVYFISQFIEIADKIRKYGHQKPYKGVDEFQDIWKEWYAEFTLQGIRILRATALVSAMRRNESFSKDQLDTDERYNKLTEPYKNKIKGDTKLITLALHKEGLKVEEISAKRQLAESTIASHLAHFIEEGEIDVFSLISKKKLKNILIVSNTIQSEQLSPIKSKLGDEYTYEEIRYAIAHKKQDSKANK